jgi:hypothetical protein|tara:strand:- start:2077 stop:2484 length:408 start_codon:yes stop_codon:yes gene_type:complete
MGTVRVNVSVATDNVLATPVTIVSNKSFEADSGSVTRVKLAPVASAADNPIIYKASDKLDRAYVYIRNLATELEKFVYLWADGGTDDIVIAKLGGGECTFIPVPNGQTFRAYGTDVDQLIEYAVFGLDNSSTTLG